MRGCPMDQDSNCHSNRHTALIKKTLWGTENRTLGTSVAFAPILLWQAGWCTPHPFKFPKPHTPAPHPSPWPKLYPALGWRWYPPPSCLILLHLKLQVSLKSQCFSTVKTQLGITSVLEEFWYGHWAHIQCKTCGKDVSWGPRQVLEVPESGKK